MAAMNSKKTHIEFDCDDGVHYKLEITANSLKKAEKSGVNLKNLADMPFTAPETVFWIACLKNHPTITKAYAAKLFNTLKRTADNMDAEYDEDGEELDGLTSVLLKMVDEAATELTARSGNRGWSVT
jgi:hypothetical protein